MIHRSLSHQKLRANRLNSQRSTGPKSTQGKRKVSGNALRHGLSTPLDPSIVANHWPELVSVIKCEGFEAHTAQMLATKILEYERNEVFQVCQYAQSVDILIPGITPTDSQDQSFRSMMTMLLDLIDYHRFFRGSAFDEEKEFGRMKRSFGKHFIKAQSQEADRAKRFFKRASNQLIKALRQLDPKVGCLN